MAEVFGRDGAWSFDGEIVRIVPGDDRGVHRLRRALGELTVPLEAVAGAAYEPGRKGGRLRLRLRDGADPFSRAVAGLLPSSADPYQLAVEKDRSGVAEYLVEDLRNHLQIEQVPAGPTDRYLLPGPSVPLTTTAGDGTVVFDGGRVRLEWNWLANSTKKSLGPQQFDLTELSGVEWNRQSGLGYGYLRFRLKRSGAALPAEEDPHALSWGVQREGGLTALVAAAVLARLPHPARGTEQAAADRRPAVEGGTTDADTVLRRLRELGELHKSGVLTDEEFATAKRALLRRM